MKPVARTSSAAFRRSAGSLQDAFAAFSQRLDMTRHNSTQEKKHCARLLHSSPLALSVPVLPVMGSPQSNANAIAIGKRCWGDLDGLKSHLCVNVASNHHPSTVGDHFSDRSKSRIHVTKHRGSPTCGAKSHWDCDNTII